MMCGTPVTEPAAERPRAAPEQQRADPETLRFIRAVVSRPATFTFVFIIANVFLYLLMWLSGGATGEVLLAYGAKRNDLIRAGEWWRLVAPIFLHVYLPGLGPLHLLANMYGLFMLGPFVEKLYGSARFVVFWVLTGVAGVAASYLSVRPDLASRGTLWRFLFRPFDTASAGASGALFGLIGVLFVFGIKYRHELPEGLKRAFGTGMLPTILINLFIGYVGRGFIDNAAHVGGLVSGMAMALAVGYKRPGERRPAALTWHFLQVGCLLLVAASFVMVARRFDVTPPRLENLPERVKSFGQPPPVVPFIESVNAGQNALIRFFNDDAGALADAERKLTDTPHLSDAADALRDDLKRLVSRARESADDKALKPAERARRAKQMNAELTAWQGRFDEWVAAEGEDLGVKIQKPRAEEKK